MAARDTAGEMCWKCLHKPAADEPPTTGSVEQIVTLRTIVEQTLEHQRKLSINLIDFEKAFDGVPEGEQLVLRLRCSPLRS
ncbi:cyclin-dependent kinase 5 activator 1 [Sarotherodon galilaeus]